MFNMYLEAGRWRLINISVYVLCFLYLCDTMYLSNMDSLINKAYCIVVLRYMYLCEGCVNIRPQICVFTARGYTSLKWLSFDLSLSYVFVVLIVRHFSGMAFLLYLNLHIKTTQMCYIFYPPLFPLLK